MPRESARQRQHCGTTRISCKTTSTHGPAANLVPAEWHPLMASKLESSNGAQLRALSDRSIRAEGPAEKGVYTLTFHTRLQGITGLRLEALPVEGIPGGGPGLPENGNFVVTEFEVQAAPADAPTQFAPVPLDRPAADFTQQGFAIQQAIDGVTQDQLGWAVAPAGGTVHWATFQTRQPVGDGQGTWLQVRIHQFHEAKDHRLARFRVSATTETSPIGVSLPEAFASVLTTNATAPDGGREDASPRVLPPQSSRPPETASRSPRRHSNLCR